MVVSITFIPSSVENLYGELLKKFQNDGRASAIDVDLVSIYI